MIREALLMLVALGSLGAVADEGMWSLDSLPAKQLQSLYGFVPDAAWLRHARLASLQFDGNCSASFVSPSGLIMTNHHCVDKCLRTLSAVQKVNYNAKPFVARSQATEVVCPDTEVEQLLSTDDVTEKVRAATKGVAPEKFHDALVAVGNQLEKACVGTEEATIRCDLVDLYHGGQYQVFRYKRFNDIRMVFAPESSIGSFGGDPDNFNFPRFNLDVSFLRAYENGKPAVTPEFFSWRNEGAKGGEVIFVTGHPGGTDRLLTVAELEYQRDHELPRRLQGAAYRRGLLHQLARQSPHLKEIVEDPTHTLENGIKVMRGEHNALLEPRLFERKRQEEQVLRKAIAKDPALAKEVGDPWAEIAAALVKQRPLAERSSLLRITSPVFKVAQYLVRGAAQRTKPEAERLPEYADRSLPDWQRKMAAPTPLFLEIEGPALASGLYLMRDGLGTDDPTVRSILGSKSPDTVAREAVKGTKLADPKVRLALWNGGQAAIEASRDPMILLAKAFESEVLALRKRFETEVEGPRSRASERVAKAYFAVHQRDTYPDATFTLRLSFGKVVGWQRADGVSIEPQTKVGALWERATGEEPYALPPSWLSAKKKLDGATPFNFVTDNDIVGGNSGSPMIDAQRRVVGLAFDGNIESIGGSYWFDETVNRCVGVHPAVVTEALRVVYGSKWLVDELLSTATPLAPN